MLGQAVSCWKKIAYAVGLLFLIQTQTACPSASWKDHTYQNTQVRYRIAKTPPMPPWREVDVPQSHIAWMNSQNDAGILVNAHCEGVEDAPLRALTDHLLIGLSEVNVLSQDTLMRSNREALRTIVTAKLDGVLRQMAFMVVRKDGCVYDAVLSTSTDTFVGVIDTFDAMTSDESWMIEARPQQ